MTISVAAVTATGAWYGAGLKTRQEFREVCRPKYCWIADWLMCLKEKKVATQATPAERIAQLEAMKARHLTHRAELQSKIDRLAAKTTSTAQDT